MFSEPEQNVKQFSIGEGWHVADFGVGSGAYAIAAADAVGSDGRVYAVDVQNNLLTRVKKEAQERGLGNIEVVCGDIEEPNGSKLKDGSMDAVIVSNLLFQVDNKKEVAGEVKRVLRKNGRVLVVDWTGSYGGLGPHNDHIFSKDKAKDIFQEAGFEFEKDIQAGEHHYGLIFKKN